MARTSWNDDYIPNEADWVARKEHLDSLQANHTDPRHSYKMTYEVDSIQQSETVFAVTEDDAIAMLKQQWGMVGIIPRHIMAERVFES